MMTKILFVLTNIIFIYSQSSEIKDANSLFFNAYALIYINIAFMLMLTAINDLSSKLKLAVQTCLEYLFLVHIFLFSGWYLYIYSDVIIPFIVLLVFILLALNFDEYRKSKTK